MTRLVLRSAPGARINARLAPVLEREGSRTLQFHSGLLTADSAYFVAPPELLVEGRAEGMVRASVCPRGESVCRTLELRLE
jgi:hypothetical protein